MNPVVASALFGFVKGFMSKGKPPDGSVATHFAGPIYEEMAYRALPIAIFGDKLPNGWTALAFAIDHLSGEVQKHHYTTEATVARFADVFLGGVLYERAYRRWGLFGAVASHVLHNIAVNAGSKARGKADATATEGLEES